MAIAAFLDKYFECVEYLPLDLQRCVTQLRAVDMNARGAVEDLKKLKAQLHEAVEQGNTELQALLFRQLQETLLITRDLGNQKLKVSAQLLEIAEDYEQQLQQKQKAVDHSSTEEFYHAHRLSSGTKEHTPDSKPPSKRSTGSKRVRPHHPPEPMDEDSSNGRSKEPLSHPNNSTLSNGRSAKKKVKAIKKKSGGVSVKVSTDESPPPFPAVPMPDLTSQPLDPDEPTYCLCQQVSFGEMIGCDNDDCPIEWFHFQCVNLTSKPKGKWYCPQCSQSRKGSKPMK